MPCNASSAARHLYTLTCLSALVALYCSFCCSRSSAFSLGAILMICDLFCVEDGHVGPNLIGAKDV
jgi:hypothetical protein